MSLPGPLCRLLRSSKSLRTALRAQSVPHSTMQFAKKWRSRSFHLVCFERHFHRPVNSHRPRELASLSESPYTLPRRRATALLAQAELARDICRRQPLALTLANDQPLHVQNHQSTQSDFVPLGRCTLPEFLEIAAMTRNTFFRAYRHNPQYVDMLDVQINLARHMHMPVEAAHAIAREREAAGKTVHGNRGRKPSRACPGCGISLPPRQQDCPNCGWEA